MTTDKPTPAIRIQSVSAFMQREDTMYIFSLTAEELLEYGRIERFNDSENGVQRERRERHVLEIADAMINPETIFVEPIVVHLTGDWTFSNGVLKGKPGSFLSIDDGQHRFEALQILNPAERERWSFPVNAPSPELSHERRVRMFLQQDKGKSIDPRLQLAQRDLIGEWPSETHRDAYEICKVLNRDSDSPLKGAILFEDMPHRPREDSGVTAYGINVKGLHNALVTAIGRKSALSQLGLSNQIKVIKTFLRIVAEEIWPSSWKSDKHVLSTSRGINTLLRLFVSSPEFRGLVGTDFTEDHLRAALQLLKSYSWTVNRHKSMSEKALVDRLNQTIANARHRSMKAEDFKVDK